MVWFFLKRNVRRRVARRRPFGIHVMVSLDPGIRYIDCLRYLQRCHLHLRDSLVSRVEGRWNVLYMWREWCRGERYVGDDRIS